MRYDSPMKYYLPLLAVRGTTRGIQLVLVVGGGVLVPLHFSPFQSIKMNNYAMPWKTSIMAYLRIMKLHYVHDSSSVRV